MSFLPDDRGAELRALFFESASELLQTINDAGLQLEKRPADEELIRSVRRAMVTKHPNTITASVHGMRSSAGPRATEIAALPRQAAVTRNMRCCFAIGPMKYCAGPQATPSVRT